MELRIDPGVYLPGTKGKGGNVMMLLRTDHSEMTGYSMDLHRYGVKITNKSSSEWVLVPWHNVVGLTGTGELKP